MHKQELTGRFLLLIITRIPPWMEVGCGGRMVDSVLGGHEFKEPRSWGVKRLILHVHQIAKSMLILSYLPQWIAMRHKALIYVNT